MADGRVEFEVVANDKSIKSSIRDITKEIEKESRKWDDAVDESTDSMGDSFSKFLKGVAKGFAAAGIGKMLLDIGKASVSAASDLAEVQNVVDVTFGDSAAKIESWSKTAGKQFGLTETQAKRFTSTLGAMMKSAGMNGDEIVGMSTDLAGLAADMASFYNLDFETAFEKIRSGISGETEPLKQLGINMSVANLEAFALEKGIKKTFNSMSQGEQTMLRYQYLMQATTDAQGDFARTSDGFANASRRVETAMDTIKTKGGGLLLEVVEPLVSGLADFLTMVTDEGMTTALDDMSSIDERTGAKVSNIQKTAEDAGYLTEELEKLAQKANLTGDEQAYWLETCKRLVQTIPGLSSIINTETGEVKGGTEAVREYIRAWEEGQTKLAMLGAIQQKEDALSQRFSDLPGLQLDMALEQKRERDALENLKEVYKKYGIEVTRFTAGIHKGMIDDSAWRNRYGIATSEFQELKEVTEAYNEQEKKAKEATDAYNLQADALEEAKQALKEYKAIVEEMPGDTEAAEEALEEWQEAAKAVGPALLESAKNAIEALADYVQGVHDATETAVDSVVKGFERLSRPTTEMEEKRSKLIEQQNALNTSTEEGKRKYQELQKQIDELNNSMDQYSASGMEDSLKSQLAFMDEYIKNLELAQRMGLSDELLASLSDGSVQSAEYLAQLVASPQQAAQIDALYKQVQEKKNQFTDSLTEQKLAGDATYQSLVDKAQETIEDLDLGQEASDAMKSTVEGLAAGLAAGVPDLSNSVTAVIAQLNRLSSFGISVSVPTFGSFYSGGYSAAGAGRPTMNYDGLGSVIKGNSGGNVYLDGRQVGSVISAQQGNSYRQLQRSGWKQ
jgi:hypothetical protein